jgi:LuxR family maltose regulon positive regulatory protein
MDAAAVVVTKIEPPALRAGHVRRPALVERLDADAGQARLVLLVAPAGSGKSSLLAEWGTSLGGTFAWLALDAGDNDPARFWAHVVAAYERGGVGMPAGIGEAMAAPGARAAEVLVPRLVNALAAQAAPAVLALDDYHLIVESAIHEDLALLVQHLPAGARLAIASRSVPALGSARLRARGQLAELPPDALRFSDAESAALLNGSLRLGLSTGELAALQRRTEGWTAGVYLAGLSLRDASDRQAAIDAFSGTERHVVDYLAEEVLGGLPPALRAFLLETSILDALAPSLCDAARAQGGSRELLEDLERSNLFLIPLDARGDWFRYHHLFQAVLRRELERTRDPDDIAALHARAAAWHAEHGDATAAIGHWVRAGDPLAAAALVGRIWNDHLQRGRMATVRGWLDGLPDELVERDPQLCLARAWILFDSGELAAVPRWTAAATAADDGRPLHHGGSSVSAAVAMLHATLAYMVGDLGHAAALSARAVELERDAASAWRAVALATLGTTTYWTGGGIGRAVEALEEAIGLARPGVNSLAALRALGMRAIVALDAGDHDAAGAWVARAGELRVREALDEYPMGAYAHAAAGGLAVRAGDLAAARAALERARVLALRGGARPVLAYVLTALAPVVASTGGPGEANEVLREARAVVAACRDPGLLGHALADVERRLRGRPDSPAAVPEELSDRELAVLRLLPSPLTFAEIGATLYVSKNTVRTHAQRIYRKLGVSSRAGAVAAARRGRLL